MILTKEEDEDFSDAIYILEIESYPSDADPKDSKYQRVELSEEAILGLKKLQGAAELEETESITLRFRPIRSDLLPEPVELSADQLKNLVSAINLLTSGLLDDRFKGIAYPVDGDAPYLVVK